MGKKIVLLGYGRMGKEVEDIALERGHEILLRIKRDNAEDLNPENLKSADVAIDFSLPEAAPDLIQTCLENKVPVVSGTTGWLSKKSLIEDYCKEKGSAFLYASNFSIGVNVFFALNKFLAETMKDLEDYSVKMAEVHHTGKKDAPSGTAISLAHEIIQENSRYSGWNLGTDPMPSSIPIEAIREAGVPGTHEVEYQSEIDSIKIIHQAHNRKGFALGAVMAAEFIIGKAGLFDMNDVIQIQKNA